MASWRCIRCGVLGYSIPRYDDRICLWCAREVAEFSGVYCESCHTYHPADDCGWEDRRQAHIRLTGWLCERTPEDAPVLPEDVAAFFRRIGMGRA